MVKSPIREDHRVPQVLQLAHLVEHHGVADVDVRRGRVEPQLDAQGTPVASDRASFFSQSACRQQFFATSQRTAIASRTRSVIGNEPSGCGVRRVT